MHFPSLLLALLPLAGSAAAAPANQRCPRTCADFSTTDGSTGCAWRNSGDPAIGQLAFNCFVDMFYVEGNASKAILTFADPSYINHNPYLPDGRDALVKVFGSANTTATVFHRDYVNGTGYVHWRLPSPIAVVDVFRISGACFMEHWDVSQSVPANATNPHPLF